jgi:hypothetical protein
MVSAQLTANPERTLVHTRRQYRAAACGAVLVLAVTGGVVLGARPAFRFLDGASGPRESVAAVSRPIPKDDARYTLTLSPAASYSAFRAVDRPFVEPGGATGTWLPRSADRWYLEPSSPRSINAADRWYAGPETPPASPNAADRSHDGPPATGLSYPRLMDR